MRDGDDPRELSVLLVDDLIRETHEAETPVPRSPAVRRVTPRRFFNQHGRALHFGDELFTESGPLIVVPLGCMLKLRGCPRAELNPHALDDA